MQNLVANAVGLDPARGDTIAVSTPSFLKADEAAGGGRPRPAGRQRQALAPTVLGGVLLLLVALGLLRTLKRGSVQRRPGRRGHRRARLRRRPGRAARRRRRPRPASCPPALRRAAASEPDLLNLVDENPDEVTALLRGWLAELGE